MFEEITKLNKDVVDYWTKMVAQARLNNSQESVQESWRTWTETTRSMYQMSVSNWEAAMEQTLELWMRSLKGTQSYRKAWEQELRDAWERIIGQQASQEQIAREFFQNLANALQPPPPEAP